MLADTDGSSHAASHLRQQDHLTLQQVLTFVHNLTLHDLAILVGVLIFLMSSSFSAGKYFEQFQAGHKASDGSIAVANSPVCDNSSGGLPITTKTIE